MPFDPLNPDTYFEDFNEFSPLYTQDPAKAQARLADLQAAMAYAQSLPDTDPNKAYFLDEAAKDIESQQAVSQYAKLKTAQPQYANLDVQRRTGADLEKRYRDILTQLGVQPGQPYSGRYSGQIQPDIFSGNIKLGALAEGLPEGAPTQGSAQYLVNFYNTWLQDQMAGNKDVADKLSALGYSPDALSAAETGLVDKFRLSSPNYASAANKLREFYYGAPGQEGQVTLATKPAIENLYQTNFNLRNKINQAAAKLGATTGSRQKALSELKGQTVQKATDIRSGAETEAAKAMSDFQKSIEEQTRAKTALENQIKSGRASDLFGQSAQGNISSFQANTQAQADEAMTRAQQRLAERQSEDQFLSGLFGEGGGALGKFGGSLVGELV